MQVKVQNGKLNILQEGKLCKFRQKVQEKTFAGISAGGREVLYITERCVFKLVPTEDGPRLQLSEVAPGVAIKEDILDRMEFKPIVKDVTHMDARCFMA